MSDGYSIRQIRDFINEGTADVDEYIDIIGVIKRLPLDDQEFIQQHMYQRIAPANNIRRVSVLARKIERMLNG